MLGYNYIKGKRELHFTIEVWSTFPETHLYKTIKGYAANEQEAKDIWFYWSMVYKYDIVKLPKFNKL